MDCTNTTDRYIQGCQSVQWDWESSCKLHKPPQQQLPCLELFYIVFIILCSDFCNDKILIYYLPAPPTQPRAEMNEMRFWNSDCAEGEQHKTDLGLNWNIPALLQSLSVWQLGPIITILSHVKLVTSSTKFPILKFNKKNYITALFSLFTLSSVWKLIQTDIWANKVWIVWDILTGGGAVAHHNARGLVQDIPECPDSTSRWSPLLHLHRCHRLGQCKEK